MTKVSWCVYQLYSNKGGGWVITERCFVTLDHLGHFAFRFLLLNSAL